jgi:hypothetical protein
MQFSKNFYPLAAEQNLTLGETRCIVIAGNTSTLADSKMKESFELQREHMRGVTVIGFDELFRRLDRLTNFLEGRSPQTD